MTEMTNTLDKRNFCLMLSSITGQSVANQLGFAPVSQDVEELEHKLVEEQWETLHDFGVFDEIVESVEWFTQVLSTTQPELQGANAAMVESTKTVILSYSMALVQKLLSNQKVALLGSIEYDEEYDPWAFIHNLKYSDPRDYVRPKRGPVLALRARDEFPNTLVLDLDETLVHSNLENTEEPFDFSFPVLFNGQDHEVRVAKRPHLETFMDFVSERFEIVVFTASQRVYADKLLDVLDPKNKWFKHRIFRDSCVSYEGNFMKDLTVLGRDLKKTIIIDNSPQAFSLQVDNGIPIESWYDDQTDNHLLSLLPILDELCRAEDVRDVLRQTFNLQERVRRGGLRSSASRRAARDMLAQF